MGFNILSFGLSNGNVSQGGSGNLSEDIKSFITEQVEVKVPDVILGSESTQEVIKEAAQQVTNVIVDNKVEQVIQQNTTEGKINDTRIVDSAEDLNPAEGTMDVIYYDKATGDSYYWTGEEYQLLQGGVLKSDDIKNFFKDIIK